MFSQGYVGKKVALSADLKKEQLFWKSVPECRSNVRERALSLRLSVDRFS